jgi:hypothetical protein
MCCWHFGPTFSKTYGITVQLCWRFQTLLGLSNHWTAAAALLFVIDELGLSRSFSPAASAASVAAVCLQVPPTTSMRPGPFTQASPHSAHCGAVPTGAVLSLAPCRIARQGGRFCVLTDSCWHFHVGEGAPNMVQQSSRSWCRNRGVYTGVCGGKMLHEDTFAHKRSGIAYEDKSRRPEIFAMLEC